MLENWNKEIYISHSGLGPWSSDTENFHHHSEYLWMSCFYDCLLNERSVAASCRSSYLPIYVHVIYRMISRPFLLPTCYHPLNLQLCKYVSSQTTSFKNQKTKDKRKWKRKQRKNISFIKLKCDRVSFSIWEKHPENWVKSSKMRNSMVSKNVISWSLSSYRLSVERQMLLHRGKIEAFGDSKSIWGNS